MIESLYSKYFQKSRSFLYPILGIKRTSIHGPIGTYIACEPNVGPEDMVLVCVFNDDGSEGFRAFEEMMLLSNPLYKDRIIIPGQKIYLFDLSSYKIDWFNFVLGKYSKLGFAVKKAIKAYYGEGTSEYKYIETYLYPEKHFDTYAKLLDVDVALLQEVGELCDPCDLEKETFKIPVEHLENSTKVL